VTRQSPTTSTVVAILGANTVVENALAQILEGEGYSARVLKTLPLGEELVQEEKMPVVSAVDLVVLAPSLSTSECDAFLAARRRRTTPHRPTTSSSSSPPIPVIVLCTPMKEAPPLLEEEDEALRSVPWPTSRERLVGEIEAGLLQAGAPRRTQRAG
jgi:CheY-like chemotaxis protein